MSWKRKTESPLEPELPITPMLDMSFQILFFFVMTYHPSALEGQFDLHLPPGGCEPIKTPVEPSPISELRDLTVVIGTQRDGMSNGVMSQLVVQSPGGVEKTMPNLKELGEELRRLRSKAGDAKDLKIQADGNLRWAFVVQVMDVCHASGFTEIRFAAPADAGGR